MQKILVPTDFSKLSENALTLAVDIARRAEAEIYLVHFMDHPFGATFSTTGEVRGADTESDLFTLQLARKNHQRLAEIAGRHGISVKVNYQVYGEDFEDGFKQYIEEQSIDLAVIATTGEKSAEEYFTGNHTQKLIESATCPIISVKGDYVDNDFSHIVVGIDPEQDDDDNYALAAQYLNTFAKGVNGHLHLVHVAELNSDKEEVKSKIQSFVDKFSFENYTLTITQNDDKQQGLLAYCFATEASILTILTHAEKSFFRMFTDSTAEEISQKSTIPVMVINLHHIT